MKKKSLAIYIMMIVVGIVGLIFYMEPEPEPVAQQVVQPEIIKETIAVAVAVRDLEAGVMLTANDFSIKNISVVKGGNDQKFNILGVNPVNYLLKNSVSAESYIPVSMLVEPGSDEYLSMSIKPENVVYPFQLGESDSYLLHNLIPGQGVDIYLEYGLNPDSHEVVSPSDSIHSSRLKPLLLNKKVLAIRAGNVMGDRQKEDVSELILELQNNEVKIVKTLQSNRARIFLFPSNGALKALGEQPHLVFSEDNNTWPISDDAIFTTPKPVVAPEPINELRG